MPKISSAAADSRLLTRALICSAFNMVAEHRGPEDRGPESQARRPAGVAQLEPGVTEGSSLARSAQTSLKSREVSPNTAPPVQPFNPLFVALFSLLPKSSSVPEPGEGSTKLSRNPEHFYRRNRVTSGPDRTRLRSSPGGGVFIQ